MNTTLNKNISLKNFLKIYIIIIGLFLPITTEALNISKNQKTYTNIKKTQINTHINNLNERKPFSNILQSKILDFIPEKKYHNFKIKKYIKNTKYYLYTTLHSYKKHNNTFFQNFNITQNTLFYMLTHKLSHANNQLKYLKKNFPHYKKNKNYITNKFSQPLLQNQITIKYTINHLQRKTTLNYIDTTSSSKQSKIFPIKLEKKTKKNDFIKYTQSYINNNNKKSFQFCTIPSQKKYIYVNRKLQILQPIIYIEKTPLIQNYLLPKSIQNQLNINHDLSIKLTQQTQKINAIISQHQTTTTHISQVHQTFTKLLEYTQWLEKSPALKEILRAQISKLPNTPNFQQLNNSITQLQKQRYQCEYQIKKLPLILSQSTQDNGTPLTLSQKNILKKQITIQNELIISLLNSYNAQILELIKLKISYETLQNALKKIKKATYRYLFWVIDVHPITISYPIDIYQDIHRLFIEDEFKQKITSALKIIFSNKTTIMLITCSIIISIGLFINMNRYYHKLLKYSHKYIGKVNQDNFLITLYNIWCSMLIALPIPIVWLTIGHILSHAWEYPIIMSIGHGIHSTTFILWIFIMSSYFASPKGLFIAHFGWPKKRIQQVFSRHYILSISIIITLTMILIIFNDYNEKEFHTTLGRLCFILLCIYLTYITNNLKNSKLPLYINKHDSSNNIINRSLWSIMIYAPIFASTACIFGYFFVAQELLMRLESSLCIWILLLIIYHLARRWISIQRRRIAFEHAKQKRAQKLALRINNKINLTQYQNFNNKKIESNKNNKKFLDLDTINTQSLQLIRSIITLTAILLVTILWSELHSAFSFLENITLWDVTSTIKGINNIQPITLNSCIIAIIVIVITTKTVHNLPAFLELTLLQHLNLTPGTKYAITALTKYILMLLGGIIGFSLIGIEWSKIQWLIAALGVGLGFGLQEIFANFISGLIILFEKPIRIGDTITIRNLTGNVTQINTRAITITDWDHKEIIIPNKEFITKQFVNWSLSDTITRVVLKIPGPHQKNVKEITSILLQIAKNTPLSLNTPPPEVYLSDLQQGFPIFEIRMYVSDTKLRMPLCHQVHLSIIEYYQKHGINLPYLPYHIHTNQLKTIIEKFPIY